MSFSDTSLWLLLVNQIDTSFQLLLLHMAACCHAHHHDGHGIMSPDLNGFFCEFHWCQCLITAIEKKLKQQVKALTTKLDVLS